MSAEIQKQGKTASGSRKRIVTGLALIVLGGIWLLNETLGVGGFGELILPGLGLVFLLWGMLTREGGLLIPGGILMGIGAGVWLMDVLPLEETQAPGVFLMSFAGGWFLILLLSLFFSDEKHLWAAWPGAILGLIGGALYMGGAALDVLEFIGKYWPVALILIGVYVLVRRK